MAIKVAIIYYSTIGTTYQLAPAVEQGASGAGADVRFRKVRELAPEEAIASIQGYAAHRLESQHVKSSFSRRGISTHRQTWRRRGERKCKA